MILADIKIAGKPRKVILHAPKNGFFFVLDRTNGKFISAKNFVPVNWASGYDKHGKPIGIAAARDSSKPGRPSGETWLLHATAEWSEAHIEATPEAVADTLLRAFAELGAPPPEAWTAHRWRYADTEPPLDACHVWDVDRRIGLCGDWLNGGKVEGAWLSGRSLAQDVLQHFGRP